MGDVILVLAVIGVTIYAAIDCLRSDDSQIRSLPKPLWMLVILALPLFGGVLWILLGRTTGPGPEAWPGSRRLRGSGPDDDPDFLRTLNPPRRRLDDEGDSKS